MHDSNIYLGQNPTATTPRYTQFMGEMHEICITKNLLSTFPSIYSLLPQRKNLLLYLTFDGGEAVG